MKMAKLAIVAAGLAVMLCARTASAVDGPNIGKLSIGYQGIDQGEDGWTNGLSTRYWVNSEFGLEGNIYYGAWTYHNYNYTGQVQDWSTLAGTVKGMYAPVVKENSRLYVGLEGGLGSQHYEDNDGYSSTDTFWMVRPLVGAEYNFPGLSEVGINFEVGYLFSTYSNDEDYSNFEMDSSGISVGLGAHYYF